MNEVSEVKTITKVTKNLSLRLSFSRLMGSRCQIIVKEPLESEEIVTANIDCS